MSFPVGRSGLVEALDNKVRINYGVSAVADPDQIETAAAYLSIAFPSEVADPATMTTIDKKGAAYFKTVRRKLERDFLGEDSAQAARICEQIGGLAADLALTGQVNFHSPLLVTREEVIVDGRHLPLNTSPVVAVDHGIGINGISSYREFLGAEDTTLFASTADEIEAAALDGLARKWGLDEKSFVPIPGCGELSEMLLDEGYENKVGITTLSRAHAIPKAELMQALKLTPRLTRPGGLAIVRAPLAYPAGLDVNKQAAIISPSPDMKQIGYIEHQRTTPSGGQEHNATYIFQKLA